MASTTGGKPPTHRRFDRAASMEQIRNRYARLRRILDRQVPLLQRDPVFRERCAGLYERGYKDWHLLSAIFNMRLNWELRLLGVDPWDPSAPGLLGQVEEIVTHSVKDADRFTYPAVELERALDTFDITCLKTYGFELRRPDVEPRAIRDFLRDRMHHYELDLPHQPLFGTSSGDWPEAPSSGDAVV
jgi:hypothetical protein